jgi:hypothetical protein
VIQQQAPVSLAEALDRANLLKGLYLCTKSSLALGSGEITPLILEANTEEEAWQKMAIKCQLLWRVASIKLAG